MSHVGALPSTEHVINRKNLIALFYVVYVHAYAIFVCFSKADELFSVVVLLVHSKTDKP